MTKLAAYWAKSLCAKRKANKEITVPFLFSSLYYSMPLILVATNLKFAT